MYLASNIRYLRKKAGMSQDQLAEKFGYSNFTTVQKWETNKNDPPVKVVKGLADLFRVNIDDLVNKDLSSNEPSYFDFYVSRNGKEIGLIEITPKEKEIDVRCYLEYMKALNNVYVEKLVNLSPESRKDVYDFIDFKEGKDGV